MFELKQTRGPNPLELKKKKKTLQANVWIVLGRAIAQAVSRRLPTAAARVQTRVWSCGIL
jgi:hypothetical protein